MVAEVIINSKAKQLNRTFDYNIPKKMEELILIGSKVLVPFGKMKTLEEAHVVKIKEKSQYEIKDIAKVENGLTNKQIELANWMAKRYFCTISDCIRLMQTPGTNAKNVNKRIQDKKINVVYLKKDFEEINFEIETKKIKSEKQVRILNFVKDNEGCTIPDIEAFTDCSRAIVNTLIKNEYLELVEQKVERNPLENKNIENTNNLKLTEEQQNAFNKISTTMDRKKYEEFLLYGVTGSGKTEVYLQLIDKAQKVGKSAIVLVPEISLTPQMLDRFISRFGKETIAVLHSKLSIGERHDEWERIKENKAKIVIGARSAIFAPVKDLGIIIIDEEHDSSYKSEASPKYDAKEVAKKIAKQENVPLVLGSATPDLRTFYNAKETEKITLLELTKRANNSNLPKVEIVDLKQELANGNRSMLSFDLYQAIEQNLKDKLQTILFLNRRGYSTFIMCRNCGYTVKCKNCNISMTYHSYENKLKCHYCGYEEKVVTKCPECGSDKIRYFGTGTQKLEQEILKQFPQAKTIRMDVDTVTKKNSHEKILTDFKENKADILIGTQMVVKGHHFPNVTLVGVIAADGSLNMNDYRANEITFQILTQVAGRAGRGKDTGKVIIQTYNPDSFAIECVKTQNEEMFYNTEMRLRKQLKYPPFCDIIVIGVSSKEEQITIKVTQSLHKYLKNRVENENIGIMLYKALPAPIDKIKNKYRWRILIKCKFGEDIIDLMNDTLQKAQTIKYCKNGDANISIDVNPTNMV